MSMISRMMGRSTQVAPAPHPAEQKAQEAPPSRTSGASQGQARTYLPTQRQVSRFFKNMLPVKPAAQKPTATAEQLMKQVNKNLETINKLQAKVNEQRASFDAVALRMSRPASAKDGEKELAGARHRIDERLNRYHQGNSSLQFLGSAGEWAKNAILEDEKLTAAGKANALHRLTNALLSTRQEGLGKLDSYEQDVELLGQDLFIRTLEVN